MSKNLQEEKLNLLVGGDQKYFNHLYSSIYPKVLSFLRLNQGSEVDAEEIFQDALFQIIVRAKTGKLIIKSSMEGYIFNVCRNLWYRELKKRKRQVRNQEVQKPFKRIDDQIYSVLHQEKWDLFEEKFELLSTNCKEILKDFFKKTPYSDMVKKFNYSSENTAFQRVFKCKKKLGELVKADLRYNKLIS